MKANHQLLPRPPAPTRVLCTAIQLDDDLYGDYRYDAYGGGDFYEEDDEEIMIDIETVIQDEIHGHSHDGREGVGDVPVPGLDSDMEGDAIHRISTGRQGAVGKEQGELEAAGSEDEDADMGPFKVSGMLSGLQK